MSLSADLEVENKAREWVGGREMVERQKLAKDSELIIIVRKMLGQDMLNNSADSL